MKAIRWTLLFTLAGFLSYALASLAGKGLPESAQHSFPSSLYHHFASKGGGIGGFASSLVVQRKMSADEMSGVEVVNVETTATDVKVVRSVEVGELEISGSISTNAQSADALSVIKDGSRILNIAANESSSEASASALMYGVWHFSSDDEPKAPGLTIEVPAGVKSVHVRTVSGNTTLETKVSEASASPVTGTPLDYQLESKSGDFFLESQESGKITIDTVSGETRSRSGVRNLDHKSVSGKLNLKQLPADAHVRSRTVSGDVFLLYTDAPNAKLSFQTVSGNLKLNLAGQKVVDSSSARELTLGSGAGVIDVQTTSGNLHVSQSIAEGSDDTGSDDEGSDHVGDADAADEASEESGSGE